MNKMKVTAQNEYGKIAEVYIKGIVEGFVNQSILDNNWEDLGYVFRPDFNEACVEYDEFRKIIESSSHTVHAFPEDAETGIDSIYCRDASIVTDQGVILCNMGKGTRSTEPEAQERYFKSRGIKILGSIQFSGLLEGGDTAWIDQDTLVVGKGYRSNAEGVAQLKEILDPYGITVLAYDLPHYNGPQDVFHLMSVFSPVDKDLAVVYSPLMPVAFRQMLLDRGYQLIDVPTEEFESMGCNVLALSPRKCMIVKGNPRTEQLLDEAGCEVISYKGRHISIAGGGGPTCLTRPAMRVIAQ
jgi:N-dimethylarginine dimethylaminohydrolase